MIVLAWNVGPSLQNVFNGAVIKQVLSIFITASILRLIQGKLYFIQSWPQPLPTIRINCLIVRASNYLHLCLRVVFFVYPWCKANKIVYSVLLDMQHSQTSSLATMLSAV